MPPKYPLTALVSDKKGQIFELEGYAAVGMSADSLTCLTTRNTRPLPSGSELLQMPRRRPLVFNRETEKFEIIAENPYAPGEPVYPVAAFNSPGYMLTHTAAHDMPVTETPLPLFSYGAVGWGGGGFRSAVYQVDKEPRQDLRRMPLEKVKAGIRQLRRQMPGNRLRRHLEHCALVYGCPAAKNFFIGRYEAPLPTSQSCNADCMGCISHQHQTKVNSSQERIAFTPDADEIARIALTHIRRVPRAVVSFGQGCEGDPLLAADVIGPAIEKIRRKTPDGTINMNTNAARPEVLKALLKTGLDAIRVSLNSVRPACYTAYFRPRSYVFDDVLASIDLALAAGAHVALNYLHLPGFSDTPEEIEAFEAFLARYPVDMIQWRNLNYDPLAYIKVMQETAPCGVPMGMLMLLKRLRCIKPGLTYGYFNPPRENWASHKNKRREFKK